MLLVVFLKKCWNTGQNGNMEQCAEHGASTESGDSVGETGGLGFNLCVAPSPKNKGVLNFEQAGETEVGCIPQR